MKHTTRALALFFVTALAAGHVHGQCAVSTDPPSVFKRVDLLAPPRDEYWFYFRLSSHVVYVSPSVVEASIIRGHGENSDTLRKVRQVQPLVAPTDIHQPFLSDGWRAWYMLGLVVLADALETGRAAVVESDSGAQSQVVVEYYSRSCSTGRRFRDSAGVQFFETVDSEA